MIQRIEKIATVEVLYMHRHEKTGEQIRNTNYRINQSSKVLEVAVELRNPMVAEESHGLSQ